MAGKVNKKLILKQCVVPTGSNISLETIIGELEVAFPKHKDRIRQAELFRSLVVSYITSPANNRPGKFIGFCLQDESATGIVDLTNSEQTVGVEEFMAPTDSAWLESEVILYVVDNHVLACNFGKYEKAISHMITELAKRGDILSDDKQIVLCDVPNKPSIQRVNDIGVRRINLDVSSYMASLSYLEPKSKVASIISAIFSEPRGPEEVKRRAQSTGSIYLSRGGKFKSHEIKKDEWLTKIGVKILQEDSDEYTLTLEDDSQISSSALRVTKTIKLNKHGNSFNRDHAHLELLNYYEKLAADGSLKW